MTIDWSKAPVGTTGAMVAEFNGSTVRRGEVEWIPSSSTQKDCYSVGRGSWVYHEAPPKWNGEGLPPVEAVCEYTLNSGISWFTCVISYIYMDKSALIAKCFTSQRSPTFIEQVIPLDDLRRVQFRPIRTAEQIEAEQRECAITDMCVLLGKDSTRAGVRENAGVLYDAGYRKQVAP